MEIRADEIASVLRQEIAAFGRELDVQTVGRVVEIADGIARVHGLSEAMVGETLLFENGAVGQALNLEERSIGAVIYGPYTDIKEGHLVRATGKLLEMPVGRGMIGRVVNPLGLPLDGGEPIEADQRRPVELLAPGIAERQPVCEPLYTGIKAVDSMIPIGRGQRELIIGDRRTGKTTIAIEAIINQADDDVLCVYVAIGQKESTVADVIETFRAHGAMNHTVVVAATSAEPAPLQYLAPYAGAAIAEHFMYSAGRDTLVVYDDLSKHAVAYRQISLLLRRPPGRDAYPGDVFYLHSRLLERSCRLADKFVIVPADSPGEAAEGADGKVYLRAAGRAEAEAARAAMPEADSLEVRKVPGSGGSLTALPIAETLEGEIAAYIPTNVISITDGQIYLEPGLYFSGIRPAVNVGISVSRVGASAQIKAMRQVAASLRLELAAFRELQAFAQLGTDVGAAAQRQLDRGARMVELLKQPLHQLWPVTDQVISLYAGTAGHLDDIYLADVARFEGELLTHVRDRCRDLYDGINSAGELTAGDRVALDEAVEACKRVYKGRRKPVSGAEPRL